MSRSIKFRGDEMRPYADISRILSNARTLTIDADGKKHQGPMEASIDDQGHVTLKVGKKAAAPAPAPKAAAKKAA